MSHMLWVIWNESFRITGSNKDRLTIQILLIWFHSQENILMIEKKEFSWNRLYIHFAKRFSILQVWNIKIEMVVLEKRSKEDGQNV